jgi:trehalose-phosphatase
MKILNPTIDLSHFFKRLKSEPSNLLFLDYDGTLAPFKTNPQEAIPYPGIRKILSRLIECEKTRLVIVSGRYTQEIIPLLNLDSPPEIWGSHGLERLKPGGDYQIAEVVAQNQKFLKEAEEAAILLKGEARLENKPGCLALHWRGLDKVAIKQIIQKIEPVWEKLSEDGQLNLSKFDGGLELRVPGKDKGDAVREVLQEMSDTSPVAYLGDDLTDEDAFSALKNRGLKVLVRDEFKSTLADVWIQPPRELMDFLQKWQEAC